MVSKTELRKKFRALLTQVNDPAHLAQLDETLITRLVTLLGDQTGVWAAFQPIGFEPNIRSIFSQTPQITWAFPLISDPASAEGMRFLVPEQPGRLTANHLGILEPDPMHSRHVDFSQLQGLLVPGLAFDAKCNRLGRGGGYYDRTLSKLIKNNPNVIKIGIARDQQIASESLPIEPFDIPMDWVLTEARCFQRAKDTSSSWPVALSERKTS